MKHDHSNYYPASGSQLGRSDARPGKPGRGGASKEQGGGSGGRSDGKQEIRLAPELLGLLCILLSALVFISLASHNPADPSFNHVVHGTVQARNWAGMFGAYLGAFLIDFLGFAAYIPFIFLAVLGARLCMRGAPWPWWRWCAFIPLACCAAVAAGVWNMGLGNVRSGGLFGRLLLEVSLQVFSSVGSFFVWSFIFLLVMQVILGFSWRGLALQLAQHLREAFETDGAGRQQDQASQTNRADQADSAEILKITDGVQFDLTEQPEVAEQEEDPFIEERPTLSFFSYGRETTETPNSAASDVSATPKASVVPAPSVPFAVFTPTVNMRDNSAQNEGGEALNRLVALAAERQATQQGLERQNARFQTGLPDDVSAQATRGSGSKLGSGSGGRSQIRAVAADGAASLGKFFRGLFARSGGRPEQSPRSDKFAQSVPAVKPGASVLPPRSVNADRSILPGSPKSARPVPPTHGEQPLWLEDLEAGRIGASALQNTLETPDDPADFDAPDLPGQGRVIESPAVFDESGEFDAQDAPATSSQTADAARQVILAPQASRPRRIPAKLPPLDLLRPVSDAASMVSRDELEAKGRALMTCLKDFSIQTELVRISPGPVVTSFEIRPAPGVKSSRISALSDDIALSLKAVAVRIQAPIPGTNTVGVEIPNEKREVVGLRELVAAPAFNEAEPLLSMALGKDISGAPTIADLAKMPHMLVAGATGTGKSVFLNSVLLSFLYRARPDELKLLLLDPKRIEMAVYADLPHLVHPIVTEMSLAQNALDWAVAEMERRYSDIARLGVRNVLAYNQKLKEMGENRPANLADLEPMPYLVIIIDEFADLMYTAGKEIEARIVRLAQLARAAGIHLIVATQRPSVDVVTGLIKANFPCRISFQVTSKHDSRTILDMVGAEYLLGRGDMLFKHSGGRLQRLHGAFVPDDDVAAVADYWRAQQKPDYQVDFTEWGQDAAEQSGGGQNGGEDFSKDQVYAEAVEFVREQGKASISLIQRRFRIGFNRAARYIEQMEQDGIIGPADGSKPRIVR